MPDEAPWTDPVVVPDDLRDLQAEIEAYHREQRLARRRRRLDRLTGNVWWRRFAFPASVGLGSLALSAVVLLVLTLGQPRQRTGPQPAPLAVRPSAPAGAVGGLLPAADVVVQGRTTSIQALRPALVVLVPQPCACTPLLDSLAAQADEMAVPLVVVAPTGSDAEVAALPGQLHRGRVTAAFDAKGTLTAAYEPSGVTALVVGPDGRVTFRRDDVKAGDRLEGPLAQMATPAVAFSAR